ncbi:MAG: hypothetical protein QM690_01320 [Sphingobium sp.]
MQVDGLRRAVGHMLIAGEPCPADIAAMLIAALGRALVMESKVGIRRAMRNCKLLQSGS